jgi:hypothetical protein
MDELPPELRRLVAALIKANRPMRHASVAVQGRRNMRHEVVTVTPALAAEWLSRPWVRQRTLARNILAKYARAMIEGRWHQPSIDPIAFTESGELLNGQHRLTALVRTGVTLQMLVAYDVPEDLFDVIDTGRARTAAQFVRGPNARALASVARMILWYDERRLEDPKHPTPPQGSAVSFDNDELLGVLEGALADTIAQSVRDAERARRWCGVPVSIHATVLTIARREGADSNMVDGWLYGIMEAVGLGIDDPRRRLRQRLTDSANSQHIRRSVPAVWMLTVRAFNAYMQGRPVKVLKYESEDAAPAIDLTGNAGHREVVQRGRAVTRPAGVVTETSASQVV